MRNYQVTLKAIKLWAKNKGIYSQIYGYLGGAAYSIMLAKICQLYPHYSPLQLLDRFFIIYSNWVWTLPLSIEKIDNDEREESEMVIYTPLSPKMNAAHYVSRTTSIITKRQLQLASKLVKEITRGSKSWRDLFKPYNYLQ